MLLLQPARSPVQTGLEYFFLKLCFQYKLWFYLSEQVLEFMHKLPAFANMTMSLKQEFCTVMVFAVVERAGTIVLNDGEEVRRGFYHLENSRISHTQTKPLFHVFSS